MPKRTISWASLKIWMPWVFNTCATAPGYCALPFATASKVLSCLRVNSSLDGPSAAARCENTLPLPLEVLWPILSIIPPPSRAKTQSVHPCDLEMHLQHLRSLCTEPSIGAKGEANNSTSVPAAASSGICCIHIKHQYRHGNSLALKLKASCAKATPR